MKTSGNRKKVELEELPAPWFFMSADLTQQIAAYFKRLLSSMPDCGNLILPSAHRLSDFFRCPEINILKGLQELERQGFHYEVYALDNPIRLFSCPARKEGKGKDTAPAFHGPGFLGGRSAPLPLGLNAS